MTKISPLTAQALGRSPYDDVVQGEGQDDPHAPPQQYDERGRPTNPDTKRLNRDIIRAHNEVMQVIGVAEPDMGPSTDEIDSARRYIEYDEAMGSRLLRFARTLEVGAVWGVNGLRSRILLYKRYADVSFLDLLLFRHRGRSDIGSGVERPLSSLFVAGLPTSLVGHVLKMVSHRYWVPHLRRRNKNNSNRKKKESWISVGRWSSLAPAIAITYIRAHLQLYVFLQRVGVIPAIQWFPSWTFFVPGLASSPIPAPAPPADLSPASLMRYAGAWCVNAGPVVSFVCWSQVWTRVTTRLWQDFYARLPNTAHHRKPLIPQRRLSVSRAQPQSQSQSQQSAGAAATAALPATEEPAAEAGSSQEPVHQPRQPVDLPPQDRTEVLRDIDAQASGAEADGAQADTEGNADSAPAQDVPRRPSGSSNRGGGDDFGSDDEEENGISATLISFDVEATDATDAPPGLWSAELRPSQQPGGGDSNDNDNGHDNDNDNSNSGDGGGEGSLLGGLGAQPPAPPPTYLDTMLTRLPACLASDIFTVVAGYTFLAPVEAVAMRRVARSYAANHMGGAVAAALLADMYSPNVLTELTWRGVTNFVGLEFVHLAIAGEVWALVTSLAQLLHMSEEEWKLTEEVRAAQRAVDLETERVDLERGRVEALQEMLRSVDAAAAGGEGPEPEQGPEPGPEPGPAEPERG